MNISESEFEITYQDKNFLIFIDEKPLKTPNGKLIKHENQKVLLYLQYELECIDKIDPVELSFYSLLSVQIDHIETPEFSLDRKTFRSLLLKDPTLKACAGPEKIYQFSKWDGLFEHLQIINIDYPDIIQVVDIDDIEKWILSKGRKYTESIDKFVNHFYIEFNTLSIAQKTAVIRLFDVHDSIIYGLLLVTKKCSVMEYSAAILASHCIIPNVFGDVVKSEYRESFQALKQDALLTSNFVDLSLTPNIELTELIKSNFSNWGLLPIGARYSLVEAIKNIHIADSDDYSSYVMLLGKSVEVSLKQLVFDEFQARRGVEIIQDKESSLFIKQNEQVHQLAKFIAKEPHFIELGSMLIILEKYGGRTSKRIDLLRLLFDFVIETLKYDQIIGKLWIEKAKIISHARNKAAHSDRFTLDEAKVIQKATFEILRVF